MPARTPPNKMLHCDEIKWKLGPKIAPSRIADVKVLLFIMLIIAHMKYIGFTTANPIIIFLFRCSADIKPITVEIIATIQVEVPIPIQKSMRFFF